MSDANNCFTPHILKPLIGDSFRVVGAEADTVNLELIEVEEVSSRDLMAYRLLQVLKGMLAAFPLKVSIK